MVREKPLDIASSIENAQDNYLLWVYAEGDAGASLKADNANIGTCIAKAVAALRKGAQIRAESVDPIDIAKRPVRARIGRNVFVKAENVLFCLRVKNKRALHASFDFSPDTLFS